MVPVVPTSGRDHVVEVGVREDDPRVLAHGPADVQFPCSCDPAVHKCEPGPLACRVPVLGRNGPELVRYRMELAILNVAQVHYLFSNKKNKKKICMFLQEHI